MEGALCGCPGLRNGPKRQLVGKQAKGGKGNGEGAFARRPSNARSGMRTTQTAGTQVGSKADTAPTPKARGGQIRPDRLTLSVFLRERPFESR